MAITTESEYEEAVKELDRLISLDAEIERKIGELASQCEKWEAEHELPLWTKGIDNSL
jgi:chaperonin cofactor prefoldin